MKLTSEQEAKMLGLFRQAAMGLVEVEEKEKIIEGKVCSLAFYLPAQPGSRRLIAAITKETFEANRKRIEEISAAAAQERQAFEIRNSWITLALADRLLVSAGRSWETGLEYFQLRARLPGRIWRQVARFFQKVERGGDEEAPVSGWVVIGDASDARCVLRKLAEAEATEAHRQAASELLAQQATAKQRAHEAKIREQRLAAILERIELAFANAEKPNPRVEAPEEAERYMSGFEKMTVKGERIDDPLDPPNIHGGGRWFVLQPEKGWIWMITNNGSDGDDWTQNNVATGGAGAIGVRVPYSESLAQEIRSLIRGDKCPPRLT